MRNVVKISIPRGSKLRVKQTMNRIASAKTKPKTKKV